MARTRIPLGFTADERDAFSEEILAEWEGSDRAVVLASGAMIDELLRRLLFKYFADGPVSQEILDGGPNAPLGSFSARIKLAFALGLITDREMGALDTVRSIRNDFAHKLRRDIDPSRYVDKLQAAMDLVESYTFLAASRKEYTDAARAAFKTVFGIVAVKLVSMLVRRLGGQLPPPGRGVGKPSL